jgi:hypothetical protein
LQRTRFQIAFACSGWSVWVKLRACCVFLCSVRSWWCSYRGCVEIVSAFVVGSSRFWSLTLTSKLHRESQRLFDGDGTEEYSKSEKSAKKLLSPSVLL